MGSRKERQTCTQQCSAVHPSPFHSPPLPQRAVSAFPPSAAFHKGRKIICEKRSTLMQRVRTAPHSSVSPFAAEKARKEWRSNAHVHAPSTTRSHRPLAAPYQRRPFPTCVHRVNKREGRSLETVGRVCSPGELPHHDPCRYSRSFCSPVLPAFLQGQRVRSVRRCEYVYPQQAATANQYKQWLRYFP